MKLNADILFDFLSPVIPLIRYGKSKKTLHLCRPEFYNGEGKTFKANHLYISFSDRLPDEPQIEDGAVFISLGGIPPVRYTEGKSSCLVINRPIDLYAVFNHVQQLYNSFDEWDEKLRCCVEKYADINDIVEFSSELLGMPAIVLDKKFRHLASNSFFKTIDALDHKNKQSGTISLDGFSKATENVKIDVSTKTPFVMDTQPESLAANLFNSHNAYIGSITMLAVYRAIRPSDYVLIDYWARYLEKAVNKLPSTNDDRLSNLKSIFSDLLQGIPSNPKKLRLLENYKQDSCFICMKLVLQEKLYNAPLGFIASMLESSVPNSIAFPYDNNVVCFVETDKERESTDEAINNFSSKMKLKIGISEPFTDLLLARFYYRQTNVALEHGEVICPQKAVLYFSDFTLFYLLSHCFGEFPLDILIPNGLKQICERDREASTNYLETLKVYLDNNMNVSKTASELFLHRSSLADRLKRIEKYLNVDLEDPDQRLMIQIFLKTMDFNEQIKKYTTR